MGPAYSDGVSSEKQFHSLEDFLAPTLSHVDGVLDDGWGSGFPVKGREIEATVLFADISGFSTRTLAMSPAATLIYVQNFFAWITAEALRGRPGIVDKYIGDEVMVVFSDEFGSEDPFADAVQAAAAMSRRDIHSYGPHIGIASGRVIVGYAGTALRYNVSAFGFAGCARRSLLWCEAGRRRQGCVVHHRHACLRLERTQARRRAAAGGGRAIRT